MYYISESDKPFEQASADLDAAVKKHGFGVLHIHDIGATLRSKGMDFSGDCHVFEVCNPQQAVKVLATDLTLNMALPCRISVYVENGKTKVGMIEPVGMLSMLSEDESLRTIAKEVEADMVKMIDEAC